MKLFHQNSFLMIGVIAALLILAVSLLSYIFFARETETPSVVTPENPDGIQQACTMEAKICPDGTAVGRTGPNCEFAPCP